MRGGVRVEHIRISGGRHQWPGATPPDPGPPSTFCGACTIWRFFSRLGARVARWATRRVAPAIAWRDESRSLVAGVAGATRTRPAARCGTTASLALAGRLERRRRWPHAPSSVALRAYHVPPLLDSRNVYAADLRGELSPVVRRFRPLVYVPNSGSNTVDEIDPSSYRIVRQFTVGAVPQHIVPSYDLRRLWVTNDIGNSLTPINPANGKPGATVPVDDPYNLYFSPDGRYALVMAESLRRIDFRNARTMKMRYELHVPSCAGVNHADFTANGRYMLVSCEFAARMVVVDVPLRRVVRDPEPAGASVAAGCQALARRPAVLRRRPDLRGRLGDQRPGPSAGAAS